MVTVPALYDSFHFLKFQHNNRHFSVFMFTKCHNYTYFNYFYLRQGRLWQGCCCRAGVISVRVNTPHRKLWSSTSSPPRTTSPVHTATRYECRLTQNLTALLHKYHFISFSWIKGNLNIVVMTSLKNGFETFDETLWKCVCVGFPVRAVFPETLAHSLRCRQIQMPDLQKAV